MCTYVCTHYFSACIYLLCAHYICLVQGTGDVNADFRVKESPDGALYLESVTCPTACVGIQSEGQLKTGLSVFLMVCR